MACAVHNVAKKSKLVAGRLSQVPQRFGKSQNFCVVSRVLDNNARCFMSWGAERIARDSVLPKPKGKFIFLG
jgi:hypothetical protein